MTAEATLDLAEVLGTSPRSQPSCWSRPGRQQPPPVLRQVPVLGAAEQARLGADRPQVGILIRDELRPTPESDCIWRVMALT